MLGILMVRENTRIWKDWGNVWVVLVVRERKMGENIVGGHPVCMPCAETGRPGSSSDESLQVKVKLVFQEHVGVHWKTAASTEQVHDGLSLLEQSVHDRGSLVDHGGL